MSVPRSPLQSTFRWLTIFAVTATFLVMVCSVVWNNVEQNHRETKAQEQISVIAHQRDVALQEIHTLVASNAANTARDAENITRLLNYVSALNNRDALLFRYLHRLKVPVPEQLLAPIPVPRLIATTGSSTARPSTPTTPPKKPKGKHHPPKA